MKNKNLALVAVLFTISVIMAFANGPTPQVVIDTDQIADAAVTAIKTDGSLATSDLSNVPATATLTIASATFTDRVDSANASFSGDIDVTGDVGAATVNGVAPLTAAEKTQALVGSTTVDFSAENLNIGATYRWKTYDYFNAVLANGSAESVSGYTVGANDQGEIWITDRTNTLHAKFRFHGRGAGYSVEVFDDAAAFTPTKNAASAINVYIDSGALTIQNNSGGSRSIKAHVQGFDE